MKRYSLAVLHMHVGTKERVVGLGSQANHPAEGFGMNPHMLAAGNLADRLHHVTVGFRQAAGKICGRCFRAFDGTHHHKGRGERADEAVVAPVHELNRLFGLCHQFVEGELLFNEAAVLFLCERPRIGRIGRSDRRIFARADFSVPADMLSNDAGVVAPCGVRNHRNAAGNPGLQALQRRKPPFGMPVGGRRAMVIELR